MPYIRPDEDGVEYDADDQPTHTGPFDYYPPEEVAYEPKPFDPADLSPAAAAAYAMLREVGLVRFRVRYDGGHDEGFAHADGGRTADGTDWPADRLVAELATPERIGALRSALHQEPPGASSNWPPDHYAELDAASVARDVLDALGDEMASCLLGQGYGTGEYSMYGAFTADLTTGTLSDEPDAPLPPDVTFD